jgi:hypothetical protein
LLSSCTQHGVIAVDAPRVLWSQSLCVSSLRVWHVGSWLWSSRAWCGAAVAVNAACVSQSRALHLVGCGGGCGTWGCHRHLCACGVGSSLPSLCVQRGVIVAIFAHVAWGHRHCLCTCLIGLSLLMHHVCHSCSLCACHHRGCSMSGHGHGLLPLHRMCHGCHLCTVCGVAVALFVPYGVSPVPLLRQVWCCGSCKRGSDGVARRDTATGQPGGTQ